MTFPTDTTPYRNAAMKAAGGDVKKALDIACGYWASWEHLAGRGYARVPPPEPVRAPKQQVEPVE